MRATAAGHRVGIVLQRVGAGNSCPTAAGHGARRRRGGNPAIRRGHLLLDLDGLVAFLRKRGRGRTELGLHGRTQSSIADFIRDLDVSKDLVKVRGTACIVVTLTSKIACHLISSLWWVEGERKKGKFIF